MAKLSDLRRNIRNRIKPEALRIFDTVTRPYSETIAKTYLAKIESQGSRDAIRIISPYFWAGILDEGRGPVRPKDATILVWFAKPALKNDPRLRGGYPKTRAQQRRLTEADYKIGLLRNELARLRGLPPVMIVRKVSAGPAEGKHFTDDAEQDLAFYIPKIIRQTVLEWWKECREQLGGSYTLRVRI